MPTCLNCGELVLEGTTDFCLVRWHEDFKAGSTLVLEDMYCSHKCMLLDKSETAEVITIKLDCDVLDPDKLIVVSIPQSMARDVPKIQTLLRDSFPDIKFMIVNDTMKMEEIEDYLSRSIQYKDRIVVALLKQEFDIKVSAILRKELVERLRKY
jgi:hypothetical protein